MLGVHQAKDELDQKKMTIQEHENWWVGTELLRTCVRIISILPLKKLNAV